MPKEHVYRTSLVWTGNQGEGTKTYAGYSRAHELCFIANSVNFPVRAEPTIITG